MPTREQPSLPALAPRRKDTPWLRRTLVFVTCVVLADSLFGDRGFAETMRARRAYQNAEAGLSRLRSDNAALRDHVRRLQSDPATIESIARKELGLIRPGEVLFLIKDVK